jgi:hypothetical protein
MRFMRPLIPCFAMAVTVLGVRPASAQIATTTLVIGQPDWQMRPDTDLRTTQINRADCLADASIDFSTTWTGADPDEGVFELWAGAGCDVSTNRTGDAPTCVKVANADAGTNKVNVRVQDLVKNYSAANNETEGTPATCDEPSQDGENTRKLWFVLYDANSPTMSKLVTTPSWEFKFDTVAPKPPTGVKAGSGENSLTVDLTAPENESNLAHYRFYCVANEGGDACSAAELVPGMVPDETFYCGSIDAQAVDSGTSKSNLTNGTSYALALAAQDSYSNIGVLSEVSCATPQEVTGFYEAYRAAGGQAGGGFCSYAPARRGAAAIALALLLGTTALLRRRR